MTEYSVEFNFEDGFLELRAKGQINGIKNMMEYSGLGISKAFEKNYQKVLIDETDLEINLSDHDQHELMSYFLNDFPKSLSLKFSVVYTEGNKEVAKFFEDLSNRVGFDCKFFLTREEALINLDKE